MPDPIISDQNQVAPPPSFPEMTDIPSIPTTTPQDIPTTTTTTTTLPINTIPDDTNETQPPIDIPPIIANQKPAKKKGGMIATILGILLLIGAVGAGVVLIGQKQLFEQKATTNDCDGYCAGAPVDCEEEPVVTGTEECTGARPYCCGKKVINYPNCGDGLSCQTATATGATPCLDGGSLRYCCPSGQILDPFGQNKCITPSDYPNCGDGLSCQTAKADGAAPCLDGGSLIYCCPSGQRLSLDGQNKCVSLGGEDFCDEVGCSGSGCTVGSSYNQTNCWVAHYWCDTTSKEDFDRMGCGQNVESDSRVSAGQSASFSKSCGGEQIDIYCPSCGFPHNPVISNDYDSIWHGVCGTTPPTSSPTPSSHPTPTPPGDWAKCWSVKAYDTKWNLLTTTDLSKLSAGDEIIFTVSGGPPDKITKARFTINGILRPETQTKKPGTEEYYDTYTISEGITSFTISAQIYHVTLGWF